MELIIVVAVLGILSGMVVPILGPSLTSMRMRNAQSDLVSLIEYVQQRAVVEGREFRLCLSKERNSYWVMVMTGREEDEKQFENETRSWGYERVLPERLTYERIKARKDRDADAFYIGCYPNGACDVARVNLVDTINRRRRISISTSGVIGRIEVETTSPR